tara:strand:+ start:270 stop:1091 length:822 start_codon:yes stop_codon:yes gene_type:complete
MKVQLTESQYNRLVEFQKRAYSFDWDDNILNMPTQIHLEKKVGDEYVPVDVSTSEFAEMRHLVGTEYRLLNDNPSEAFADFRGYDAFISDTKKAIEDGSYGPSFSKFKEALKYGNDFSIITARGQSPKALKDGTKVLIDMTFTDGEKQMMMDRLRGSSVDEYLSLQDYHPVSSDEFKEKFGSEGGAENPEIAKTIALRDFTSRVVNAAKELEGNPEYNGLSVGFSDDDLKNVELAKEFIGKELKNSYPNVRFLVYDTSDPKDTKKKRIVIQKS